MKVTFLEAEVPLTKTFEFKNGELTKIGHPRIMDYKSHEFEFETIEQLRDLIVEQGALGRCLLKGNLNRPLDWESRKGTTTPNEPTRLICLDLDGMKGVTSPLQLTKLVGMGDVDYIAQYSASSGVVPSRGLSCHIFIITDRDTAPALLKQYLMHWNLVTPEIAGDLNLTRTCCALRWPLDVTTCQNDKLIYIAPPLLGEGVVDSFKGERVSLVKRKKRFLTLPAPPSAELNKKEQELVLNTLRVAQGLASRPATQYKTIAGTEYLSKPDKAAINGHRAERGFVYLNINGGDSWAYYHPESNPEFIYNFKGEPNYRTSELLPEYWAQVKSAVNDAPKKDSQGNLYLGFSDFKTSTYWKGIFSEKTRALRIAQAKSPTQVRDFYKQHGQPVGDFVPIWDITYDPVNDWTVNVEDKQVNKYIPSPFSRRARETGHKFNPLTERILMHALGEDRVSFDHFVNWFAVIVQFNCMTQTAWVWHGIQGTGKGLFFNTIIRPILGVSNTCSKRMQEMDSDFNGFLENTQLLWIEEAEAGAFSNSAKMDANFKNYITEPDISVRHMHMMAYEVTNYLNIILSSNKDDPVMLDPTDRRYNVSPYQDQKIHVREGGWLTSDQVAEMKTHVPAWECYNYLMDYRADVERAASPLQNAAKALMTNINRLSVDVVVDAIRAGNLQFFLEQKPGVPIEAILGLDKGPAAAYLGLLERLPKLENITRDELYIIFNYIVGVIPAAPGKFTALLKHHGIKDLKTIRRGDESFKGISVNWRTS